MLEPDTRELLLDLLRPPGGWQLGHAVGTTYTLDLQALLIAPLSFAMFDWALDDSGHANPLAMLEALRRNAERTTLFCQAGMISLPREYNPLLVHLESAVVPVTPPNPHHIFHPKVWVLEFVRDDHDPRYRLICQSRNLTFDRSWDTVVALEGRRRLKRAHSSELSEFLEDLAGIGQLDDHRDEALHRIANGVRRVKFDAPDGFDFVRFCALGFRDRTSPFPQDATRTLVISPFLGAGVLADLGDRGDDNVLVSRPEALDQVGADAVAGFDRTLALSSDVFDGALLEDDEDHTADVDGFDDSDTFDHGARGDQAGETTNSILRGLHAKGVRVRAGQPVPPVHGLDQRDVRSARRQRRVHGRVGGTG